MQSIFLCSTLSNTGDPVWLENVNCNGDELHILRCGYSVVSDEGKNECTSKLIIKSGKEPSHNNVAYYS